MLEKKDEDQKIDDNPMIEEIIFLYCLFGFSLILNISIIETYNLFLIGANTLITFLLAIAMVKLTSKLFTKA